MDVAAVTYKLKKELDRGIGKKIKELRRRGAPRGRRRVCHSLDDIGHALGVCRQVAGMIEAGTRRLTAAELMLLAEYLEVPITELLPE